MGSFPSEDSKLDSYLLSIVEEFPGYLYRCHYDRDWTMVYLRGQVQRLTGYKEDELVENRVCSYADLIHPGDRERIREEVQATVHSGETFDLEYRLRTRDDDWRWVWNQGRSLEADDTHYLEGFIQDITERKETRLELQETLQEQEALRQELHHRVKNNLQFLTSLIRLKKRNYSDQQVIRDYDDLQNRVQSMALMHDMVREKSSLSDLGAHEYFARVTEAVLESTRPPSMDLDLDLDVEPIALNAATLLPCGLLLNELINNAIKHGFQGRDEGRLEISLRALPDDRLELIVRDDGRGLDEEQALYEDPSALGLRIVKSLVENKLQGEWEVYAEDGLTVTVRFRPVTPTPSEDG